MPYRLFRPQASGTFPLVVYLHGSGGLGDDNLKQMGLGNIFGTRVWALPENQKKFPCYVARSADRPGMGPLRPAKSGRLGGTSRPRLGRRGTTRLRDHRRAAPRVRDR